MTPRPLLLDSEMLDLLDVPSSETEDPRGLGQSKHVFTVTQLPCPQKASPAEKALLILLCLNTCGQWRPHSHLQREKALPVSSLDPQGLREGRWEMRDWASGLGLLGSHVVLNRLQFPCKSTLQLCGGEAPHLPWILGSTQSELRIPFTQMHRQTSPQLCGLGQAASPLCASDSHQWKRDKDTSKQAPERRPSSPNFKPTPKLQPSEQHGTL